MFTEMKFQYILKIVEMLFKKIYNKSGGVSNGNKFTKA